MSDLIEMWRNTRMVVLVALTASLYAAILIPFKVLPIIPGVTELRPANAVPVVCSFLFGPAAAWGAAIGNVIGDFFGGIGPGDLFGFAGNFAYGLIPYKAWEILASEDPVPVWHGRWSAYLFDAVWLKFLGVVLLAAASCALIIGWGLNFLGFIPFSVLGNIVLVNNLLVASTLGPLLLAVLYPRVKRRHLLYSDILPARRYPPRWRRAVGLGLVAVAAGSGLVAGNLFSTGQWELSSTPVAALDPGAARMRAATLGVAPAVALLVLGLALM